MEGGMKLGAATLADTAKGGPWTYRYVPSANKVASIEMLDQRLRGSETDERSRHEPTPKARLRGAAFDIP